MCDWNGGEADYPVLGDKITKIATRIVDVHDVYAFIPDFRAPFYIRPQKLQLRFFGLFMFGIPVMYQASRKPGLGAERSGKYFIVGILWSDET